jgi:hypothetical protein
MLMKNFDRNRAVTGRERSHQSHMFFNGVPMGLRPTNVDEEFRP